MSATPVLFNRVTEELLIVARSILDLYGQDYELESWCRDVGCDPEELIAAL